MVLMVGVDLVETTLTTIVHNHNHDDDEEHDIR
jgi:hypothetical protein